MIIYGGGGNGAEYYPGYKTSSIIEFDFIRSRDVPVKRPQFSLRELTSENREFLQKIGLKLKKQKTS